jgi:hypothetical protein
MVNRPNNLSKWKFISIALSLISVSLLLALRLQSISHRNYIGQIRYAEVLVRHFHQSRDVGLLGITNAANALCKLERPPGPFMNPAANFVEYERSRAIADLLAYITKATGEDLGKLPEPWVRKYADEKTKALQKQIDDANSP